MVVVRGNLSDDFFTCDEGLMKKKNLVRISVCKYKRLLVNAGNCKDMRKMVDKEWAAKLRYGPNIRTYDQFRSVVGQFCRLAVTAGLLPAKEAMEIKLSLLARVERDCRSSVRHLFPKTKHGRDCDGKRNALD